MEEHLTCVLSLSVADFEVIYSETELFQVFLNRLNDNINIFSTNLVSLLILPKNQIPLWYLPNTKNMYPNITKGKKQQTTTKSECVSLSPAISLPRWRMTGRLLSRFKRTNVQVAVSHKFLILTMNLKTVGQLGCACSVDSHTLVNTSVRDLSTLNLQNLTLVQKSDTCSTGEWTTVFVPGDSCKIKWKNCQKYSPW